MLNRNNRKRLLPIAIIYSTNIEIIIVLPNLWLILLELISEVSPEYIALEAFYMTQYQLII